MHIVAEKQDDMRQLLHTFGIKVKKKNEGEIIIMETSVLSQLL